MILVVFRSLPLRTHISTFLVLFFLLLLLLAEANYTYSILGLYDALVLPGNPHLQDTGVVSGYSIAPFTSIVSYRDVSRIVGNDSSARVIFEVLLLGEVNGSLTVIRGINRTGLKILAPYNVSSGLDIDDGCLACAWVGAGLASDYGIHPGQEIIVSTIFSSAPAILKVMGILDIPPPYRYEVIVPLITGQALRGIGRDSASLAIIIGGNVGGEGYGRRGLIEYAFIVLRRIGGSTRIIGFNNPSGAYLSRMGLQRTVLSAVFLSLLLTLTVGSYILGSSLVGAGGRAFTLLRYLGVSKLRIKLVLSGITALYVSTSFIISLLTQQPLFSILNVRVLNYPVNYSLDLPSALVIGVSIFLFTCLGVFTARIDER